MQVHTCTACRSKGGEDESLHCLQPEFVFALSSAGSFPSCLALCPLPLPLLSRGILWLVESLVELPEYRFITGERWAVVHRLKIALLWAVISQMSCGQAALQTASVLGKPSISQNGSQFIPCDMEAQKHTRIVLLGVHLAILSLVQEQSQRWMTAWRPWKMRRKLCGRMWSATGTCWAATSTQPNWPPTYGSAKSSMSRMRMRCSTHSCCPPKLTEQVIIWSLAPSVSLSE